MADSLAQNIPFGLARGMFGAINGAEFFIADGKPSELEYWNGAVVRLGREAQVLTPTHAHIYGCLLPQELHARGKIAFPG